MPYPIVLIHGFPMDSAMWQPQVATLTAAGYRVSAPDLPGFGPPETAVAPWPKEKYSIEAFADVVAALIRGLPERQAVVGGFSMGGYVVLALLRNHPELLRGVMLIDSRADPDTPEGRAGRMKSCAAVAAAGIASVVEGTLDRQLSRYAPASVREEARRIMLRQNVDAFIGAQEAMSRRRDQTDLLADVRVPMLFVVGADDVITPPAVARAMGAHVKGAMLVEVERAGHLANMEQPAAVSAAVETFLRTVK